MLTVIRSVMLFCALAGLAAACGSGRESKSGDRPGGSGESTLTVAELLEQAPTDEVSVVGGLNATAFEAFAPDGISSFFEVELCDDLKVEPASPGDHVQCVGESVAVPAEVADLDLDWEPADVNSQYLDDVVATGRLAGDEFVVSGVAPAGGPGS